MKISFLIPIELWWFWITYLTQLIRVDTIYSDDTMFIQSNLFLNRLKISDIHLSTLIIVWYIKWSSIRIKIVECQKFQIMLLFEPSLEIQKNKMMLRVTRWVSYLFYRVSYIETINKSWELQQICLAMLTIYFQEIGLAV